MSEKIQQNVQEYTNILKKKEGSLDLVDESAFQASFNKEVENLYRLVDDNRYLEGEERQALKAQLEAMVTENLDKSKTAIEALNSTNTVELRTALAQSNARAIGLLKTLQAGLESQIDKASDFWHIDDEEFQTEVLEEVAFLDDTGFDTVNSQRNHLLSLGKVTPREALVGAIEHEYARQGTITNKQAEAIAKQFNVTADLEKDFLKAPDRTTREAILHGAAEVGDFLMPDEEIEALSKILAAGATENLLRRNLERSFGPQQRFLASDLVLEKNGRFFEKIGIQEIEIKGSVTKRADSSGYDISVPGLEGAELTDAVGRYMQEQALSLDAATEKYGMEATMLGLYLIPIPFIGKVLNGLMHGGKWVADKVVLDHMRRILGKGAEGKIVQVGEKNAIEAFKRFLQRQVERSETVALARGVNARIKPALEGLSRSVTELRGGLQAKLGRDADMGKVLTSLKEAKAAITKETGWKATAEYAGKGGERAIEAAKKDLPELYAEVNKILADRSVPAIVRKNAEKLRTALEGVLTVMKERGAEWAGKALESGQKIQLRTGEFVGRVTRGVEVVGTNAAEAGRLVARNVTAGRQALHGLEAKIFGSQEAKKLVVQIEQRTEAMATNLKLLPPGNARYLNAQTQREVTEMYLDLANKLDVVSRVKGVAKGVKEGLERSYIQLRGALEVASKQGAQWARNALERSSTYLTAKTAEALTIPSAPRFASVAAVASPELATAENKTQKTVEINQTPQQKFIKAVQENSQLNLKSLSYHEMIKNGKAILKALKESDLLGAFNISPNQLDAVWTHGGNERSVAIWMIQKELGIPKDGLAGPATIKAILDFFKP